MSQGLVLHLQPLLKELLQSFRTQGHLVAQSVKHLTLDFSSGHDLRVTISESPSQGHVRLCSAGNLLLPLPPSLN